MELARNDSTNRRKKHIDITYHYFPDAVERNEIDLQYIPTNDIMADMRTKPLTKFFCVGSWR